MSLQGRNKGFNDLVDEIFELHNFNVWTHTTKTRLVEDGFGRFRARHKLRLFATQKRKG